MFNELAGFVQSLGLEGGGENSSQVVSDPLAMEGDEGEQCKELAASFMMKMDPS